MSSAIYSESDPLRNSVEVPLVRVWKTMHDNETDHVR
jgi:hypothetical protein